MAIKLGEEEQPEIGLIALIDCIFFLLMFFMVATSFKHANEEKKQPLPLTLPKSAVKLDAAAQADPRMVIGVDSGGGLFLNNKRVSADELRTQLHAQALRDRDQRIRIDGDQSTAYQNIVRVLDMCQFEGLSNISMHTRR